MGLAVNDAQQLFPLQRTHGTPGQLQQCLHPRSGAIDSCHIPALFTQLIDAARELADAGVAAGMDLTGADGVSPVPPVLFFIL